MKRILSSAALVSALLAAAGAGAGRAAVGRRSAAPALSGESALAAAAAESLGPRLGHRRQRRRQDHVWVTHRGADSLEGNEKGMMLTPPTSSVCCAAAPFVLAVRRRPASSCRTSAGPGRATSGRSRRAALRSTPRATSGLPPPGSSRRRRQRARPRRRGTTAAGVAAAARGTAAPTGPADAHVLKFSPDGKFLLQIGTPGKMEGPESQTTLNRPAAVAVDAAANEVYVADSGNHRIVVFNSETGAYKRHWGAYGEKPTAAGGGAYDPAAPPSRQFRDVTCVEIAQGRHGLRLRPHEQPHPGVPEGRQVRQGRHHLEEHARRDGHRAVRRRVVARLGVGHRLLERRRSSATSSSPTATTRRCRDRAARHARRGRQPSATAAASRDASSRSAASRSIRAATCTRASSTTASACRSSSPGARR